MLKKNLYPTKYSTARNTQSAWDYSSSKLLKRESLPKYPVGARNLLKC